MSALEFLFLSASLHLNYHMQKLSVTDLINMNCRQANASFLSESTLQPYGSNEALETFMRVRHKTNRLAQYGMSSKYLNIRICTIQCFAVSSEMTRTKSSHVQLTLSTPHRGCGTAHCTCCISNHLRGPRWSGQKSGERHGRGS